MKLSSAFGLLTDLRFAIQLALIPTLKAVWYTPTLVLSPAKISRLFFSHVWTTFANGTDENAWPVKAGLIPPNAYGVVLDLGAGSELYLLLRSIRNLHSD